MRYVGKLYRPPSEADALILQATIGCSWNHCTYCDMYRDKPVFRVRPLEESLEDLERAGREVGAAVEKVFVADGDALVMDVAHWQPILAACKRLFPRLRRISCYATAVNVLAKSDAELRELREAGLSLLYMGPESGDDDTLKKIAKGSTAADHTLAARRARSAGLELSAIFLLGA
ncbi:MAG: radical SAM protein, partial [Myxococcota bacterium]|nr:radical SAM protein [Myxococcota bacterium]